MMNDFFNQEYADEVAQYISGMDPDTAQMFGLFTAYDIHHTHMAGNAQTISKHAAEVLGTIRDQVAKSMLGREVGDHERATAALVGAVSKANYDRYVQTPEGAKHYKKPIGSKITVTHNPKTGKVKAKYKGADQKAVFDVTGALSEAGKDSNVFAENWTRQTDPRNSTQRTYNRVSEGSRLVRDLSGPVAAVSPSAGAAMAVGGQVGQFAGEFGPNAEKLVGPAMRRTAYRYRGTERKVDPELVQAIKNEVRSAERDMPVVRGQAKMDPATRGKLTRQANEMFARKPEGDTRTLGEIRREVFAAHNAAGGPAQRAALPPEQRQQAAMRQSVNYLRERLPSPHLARLQTSSGKVPPSEGVIIDKDGNVVAQMVGYQEDHFLPFNLKNMKALQGGSYVRTRSLGGLTSEDIYAGLVSGARSVSVVSRSGTFTLHFSDDLRGGRRYGDVARQMVDRYEKTLDAVKSRQIQRRSMDRMEMAQIRADVESQLQSYKTTPEGRAFIEQSVKDAIEEAKNSTDLSLKDYEKIEEKVRYWMGQDEMPRGFSPDGSRSGAVWPRDPAKKEAFIRQSLIEQEQAKKEARMLQLDGLGYATAMQALQEQYPYFIADVERNTSYYKDEDLGTRERATDTGYVRPRYLRPKAVMEGYFDPEIEGYVGSITTAEGRPTGKYSAAETNYQNYRGRKAVSDSSQEQGEDTGQKRPDGPQGAPSPSPAAAPPTEQQTGQLRAEQVMHADLAKTVILDSNNPPAELVELLGGENADSPEGQRNLRRAMRDPENRRKAKEAGEAMARTLQNTEGVPNSQLQQYADLLEGLQEVTRGSQSASGGKTLPEDYSASPPQPAAFPDVPEGKDATFYKAAASSLRQFSTFKSLTTDEALRDASDASLDLAKVYDRVAESNPQTGDMEEITRIVYDDWNLEHEPKVYARIQASPERARDRAQQLRERSREIEKYRRIRAEWQKAAPPREEARNPELKAIEQ